MEEESYERKLRIFVYKPYLNREPEKELIKNIGPILSMNRFYVYLFNIY